jgi:hypothetical protein
MDPTQPNPTVLIPLEAAQAIPALAQQPEASIIPEDSETLQLLKLAEAQVAEVLQKAEQSLRLLEQNTIQVTQQRIALNAQKSMLTELVKKVTEIESK